MGDFGFALRVARERRGLTQMEGMRQTGIHNKTLSGYENGFSKPDLSTFCRLPRNRICSPSSALSLKQSAANCSWRSEPSQSGAH